MALKTKPIVLAVLLLASTVYAQATLIQQAQAQFLEAQRLESALNEIAAPDRTRADYLKVINAYQRVYIITPHTGYADEALTTMARLYEETKDPADALKTLEFLLREYPGTPFKGAAERDTARLRGAPEKKTAAVDMVRYWEEPNSLRVVVDVTGEIKYKQGEAKSPDRVFIDLMPAKLNSTLVGKQWPVKSGLIDQIRVGQYNNTTVRLVLEVGAGGKVSSFMLHDPDRLVVDVSGWDGAGRQLPLESAVRPGSSPSPPSAGRAQTVAAVIPPAVPPSSAAAAGAGPAAGAVTVPARAASPVTSPPTPPLPASNAPAKGTAPDPKTDPKTITPALPTTGGNRSLVRSLGLKLSRVVIDAGHGGHDTGSIGPTGFMEKELVLDVAKRLKELVERELGAEAVMTREDDSFVPLEMRTAIANREKADLFISIHANSSMTRNVQGVETFFLNLTTSRESVEIASRENATSEKSIHELQDVLQKIMLQDKMDESRELAEHIQRAMSLRKDAGQNRGVKQAPFVVLVDAKMPSILAEIGFISNPQEERSARTPVYRQQIAESLFKGIKSYAETLSGTKTAKSQEKNQAPVGK